jgi:hypothetical protein
MANTQIAVKENAGVAVPFVPYSAGQVDGIIAKIRKECAVEKPDISTKKGREAIISASRLVSTKKMEFVREIEAAIKDQKEQVKRVDGERIRAVKELDVLRDEIRRPVTEWEKIEEERIAVREARLSEIIAIETSVAETQEQIKRSIAKLAELSEFDWQEFTRRATETGEYVFAKLQAKLAERVKYDADQAELERHRKEAVEREQREREEKIAADAAAKVLADAKAVQDKKDTEAKAEQDRKDAAAKKEREEADKKAKDERDTIAAAAQKKIDDANAEVKRLKDEADESERKRKEAEERAEKAEADKKEAERLAALPKPSVPESTPFVGGNHNSGGYRGFAPLTKAKITPQERAHQAKINNEVVEDLNKGGIQELAVEVVKLIAQGKIRHVTIRY